MSSFFDSSYPSPFDFSMRALGGVAPTLVKQLYPMSALTQYHLHHHLPGITGRWMDFRTAEMPFAGNFHRLSHGHNLFSDGFRVLVNPELKYGQFLHHLGMDSLTARGIPLPFATTSAGEWLVGLGVPKKMVYEMLTVNVPKILGGSVGLVCAGTDVLMVFSDAIPHTYSAASFQFLAGTIDLIVGCYPPNPLLWIAAGAEYASSAITAYRAFVDPILPGIGTPASVFLPILGQSIAMSALISACVSLYSGKDWISTSKIMAESMTATGVATTVGIATKSGILSSVGSTFIGPFLGPAAGIATFIIVKKILDNAIESPTKGKDNPYKNFSREDYPNLFEQNDEAFDFNGLPQNYFKESFVIPTFGIGKQPLGELKGDKLLLSSNQLVQAEQAFGD